MVGSGPAGMETARIAALRGHQVVLIEKEPYLGGSLNLAAVVKGTEREDMLKIVDYLKLQVEKAGVDMRKGEEATKETIAALKPDAVVVAVGGKHNIPDIPGIHWRQRAHRRGSAPSPQGLSEGHRRAHDDQAGQRLPARGQEGGHHRRHHPGLRDGGVAWSRTAAR